MSLIFLSFFFSLFHYFSFFVLSIFRPAYSVKNSRMRKREDNPHRAQRIQSVFPSQTSGNTSFLFSGLVIFRRETRTTIFSEPSATVYSGYGQL